LIRDAGFEVEGNALYHAESPESASSFRLEGSESILKPDVVRNA
jgi:hypothetical protein